MPRFLSHSMNLQYDNFSTSEEQRRLLRFKGPAIGGLWPENLPDPNTLFVNPVYQRQPVAPEIHV